MRGRGICILYVSISLTLTPLQVAFAAAHGETAPRMVRINPKAPPRPLTSTPVQPATPPKSGPASPSGQWLRPVMPSAPRGASSQGVPSTPPGQPPAAQKGQKPPRVTLRGAQTTGNNAPAASIPPHAPPRSNGAAVERRIERGGWFHDTPSNIPDDPMWTQGVSAETLAKRHATRRRARQDAPAQKSTGQTGGAHGRITHLAQQPPAPPVARQTPSDSVDTHESIDNALKNISEYERTPETTAATSVRRRMYTDLRTEESNWRNPITEPVKIDQQMPLTQRKVVGAYADMVGGENIHLNVGPELSITDLETEEEHAVTGGKGNTGDARNALGVGMHFQWEF